MDKGMKKLVPLALALGLLFVMVPASATHVNEPTTPITSLDLRVQHYSTSTHAPCDGSEFGFANVRIDAFVTFDSRPSEHFDVLLQISGPNGREWTAAWQHQNVPPHTAKSTWNILGAPGRTNQYRMNEKPGLWEFCRHAVAVAELQLKVAALETALESLSASRTTSVHYRIAPEELAALDEARQP